MGLFDDVAGGMLEKLSSAQAGGGGLMEHVAGLLNDPAVGGLTGLVQNFKDKGLADVLGSWISTGQNLPISAQQIQGVLGSEKVSQIASSLGIPMEQVSAGLAQLLPEVMDKLTPGGALPQGNAIAQGLEMLKGKIPGL